MLANICCRLHEDNILCYMCHCFAFGIKLQTKLLDLVEILISQVVKMLSTNQN